MAFEAIPSRASTLGKTRGTQALGPRLSLYKVPPTDDIDVEHLEQYAADRVEVLREFAALEWSKDKGQRAHDRMREVVNRQFKLDPQGLTADEFQNAIMRDCVSHWICRLAFCNSEDDKQWFIKQEEMLLKWRMKEFSTRDPSNFFNNFLKDARLAFDTVGEEEFEDLHDDLLITARARYQCDLLRGWRGKDIQPSDFNGSSFFKVPFEQVLTLVANHSVLVKSGYAFVHKNDIVPLITSSFRENIKEGLERAAKMRVRDNRIPMVLEGLSAGYLGTDFASRMPKGEIELEHIDAVSKQHFPLCMRSMHEKLRHKHHLRHGARMQYGLFLKGIGLTLEQAVAFWKSEFLHIMTEDDFKEHAYNIRHNYGKEGRRADYTPYSCAKIINSDVSTVDDHGCPFKHFSPDHLVEQMLAYGRSKTEIKAMMDDVRKGRYGLACRKYYQFTHPTQDTSELVMNHPNEYFSNSIKGTSMDPKAKGKEKAE